MASEVPHSHLLAVADFGVYCLLTRSLDSPTPWFCIFYNRSGASKTHSGQKKDHYPSSATISVLDLHWHLDLCDTLRAGAAFPKPLTSPIPFTPPPTSAAHLCHAGSTGLDAEDIQLLGLRRLRGKVNKFLDESVDRILT